jgi:hypothetical protein
MFGPIRNSHAEHQTPGFCKKVGGFSFLKMPEDVLTTPKPTGEELEQSIQKREKKNLFS